MQLQGTVAVVTGGNGGLGQRICHALAKAGSHIVVVYTQSREAAQAVASEVQQTGVRAEAMACDVAHPQQVEQLVSRVLETFGRLDILVNDAAYNKWIPFNDLDALTYEEWQKILDVNLTGPMLCTKGLIHLTRCMAVGLAPTILVNCIAPGYLEGTRATANLDPAYQEQARMGALLKRAADKDDIAEQVVAFCRPDSITGQTLAIDAGRFFH